MDSPDDTKWLRKMLLQGQAMMLHEDHQNYVQGTSHHASVAALRARHVVGDSDYAAAQCVNQRAASQRHNIPLTRRPAREWRPVCRLNATATVFTPSIAPTPLDTASTWDASLTSRAPWRSPPTPAALSVAAAAAFEAASARRSSAAEPLDRELLHASGDEPAHQFPSAAAVEAAPTAAPGAHVGAPELAPMTTVVVPAASEVAPPVATVIAPAASGVAAADAPAEVPEAAPAAVPDVAGTEAAEGAPAALAPTAAPEAAPAAVPVEMASAPAAPAAAPEVAALAFASTPEATLATMTVAPAATPWLDPAAAPAEAASSSHGLEPPTRTEIAVAAVERAFAPPPPGWGLARRPSDVLSLELRAMAITQPGPTPATIIAEGAAAAGAAAMVPEVSAVVSAVASEALPRVAQAAVQDAPVATPVSARAAVPTAAPTAASEAEGQPLRFEIQEASGKAGAQYFHTLVDMSQMAGRFFPNGLQCAFRRAAVQDGIRMMQVRIDANNELVWVAAEHCQPLITPQRDAADPGVAMPAFASSSTVAPVGTLEELQPSQEGIVGTNERLLAAVRAFDYDGKGIISATDLRHAAVNLAPNLTPQGLDELLAEADVYGDDQIRYVEALQEGVYWLTLDYWSDLVSTPG